MRKGRVTINELNSMLRFQKIFNIADVHYAILENSGTLSVLPKAENKPLTPKDMQIKPQEGGQTKDIIIDGVIMQENLSSANITESWVRNELQKNQIADLSEVFYAGLAANGLLYLSKRTYLTKEKHGVHGIE